MLENVWTMFVTSTFPVKLVEFRSTRLVCLLSRGQITWHMLQLTEGTSPVRCPPPQLEARTASNGLESDPAAYSSNVKVLTFTVILGVAGSGKGINLFAAKAREQVWALRKSME